MERQRKPFSQDDYKNAQAAFSYLKRDLAQGETFSSHRYFPVLYPEDFGIDAGVYLDQAAYEAGQPPIFLVELEIKTQSCCRWEPGKYPFPDVHFLYRKAQLGFQEQTPFWVMYNGDGTDCCIVNIEAAMTYPIAQNTSPSQDLIYMLPPSLCQFGTRNLIRYIEDYFAQQAGVDFPYLWSAPGEVFGEVNAAYANRHQFQKMRKAHEKLIANQKKNWCPVGIKQYL